MVNQFWEEEELPYKNRRDQFSTSNSMAITNELGKDQTYTMSTH